jgi:hypothetical protein
MATNTSQYPWVPGQVLTGYKTFADNVVVAGLLQIQKGTYSFTPAVTSPGTVASAGTVLNNTGVNCLVYASATTGISASKILAYNGAVATTTTPAGTTPALNTATYYVPGPGAIALTYTGTLTWTWQGI